MDTLRLRAGDRACLRSGLKQTRSLSRQHHFLKDLTSQFIDPSFAAVLGSIYVNDRELISFGPHNVD